MDICKVCGGRLREVSYVADTNGYTCSTVSVNRGGKQVNLTMMACDGCGLVYARKKERGA